MKKTFTIKFDVPILKPTDTEIPVSFNVKGMMRIIKRSMTTSTQQDLLDEYAKFWLYDQAGLESYPIIKK